MKQTFATIEIDGTRYRIGRFKLELASYLLGRIMRAIRVQAPPGDAAELPEPQQKPSPEDIARAMIGAGLFGDMDRATRAEIQKECMAVCARLEGDNDIPMPISNGSGLLIDDLGVVLKLEMEALVFNFTPFFNSGGMKILNKDPVQNSPKI